MESSAIVKMLTAGWFAENSIEQTLHNLIAGADVAYLKTVRPDEFEKLLISEVQFLAPYIEKEAQEVEDYIHQHLRELYHYLHKLAS
jgi:maleate cis-trans isomerase